MEFKNTIQSLQKLGGNVVKEGRGILKRFKPHSKIASGTLYNDFDYLVTASKDSVTLEFEFGNADDYWQFVDEGVRGTPQERPKILDGKNKGKPYPRKKGKRAANSPFSFNAKMPPRRFIDKWVVKKGLKGIRDKSGRFISRKSLVYLIQRSIFYNGLQRTQFFSRPFKTQLKKQTDNIVKSFADDLELALEQTLKD